MVLCSLLHFCILTSGPAQLTVQRWIQDNHVLLLMTQPLWLL